MEVTAWKALDGIYIEYSGINCQGEEAYWCYRHDIDAGWFAPQTFIALILGIDPISCKWTGGAVVPTSAVELAHGYVDVNTTDRRLLGMLVDDVEDIDEWFWAAFCEADEEY